VKLARMRVRMVQWFTVDGVSRWADDRGRRDWRGGLPGPTLG
jgi:hypothetical protein